MFTFEDLRVMVAELFSEEPTQEELLGRYQNLTEEYYQACYDLRYLGSSGDEVARINRERLAVAVALGQMLTQDIDADAARRFDAAWRLADHGIEVIEE